MEVSKPTLAIAATLFVVAGAGAAHLLRSQPPSATVAPVPPVAGVDASGAGASDPPRIAESVEIPAAPAAPARMSRDARPANATRTAPSPPESASPMPPPVVSADPARAAESPSEATPAAQPVPEPVAAADAAPAPLPAPLFEELVVSADSVIGLEVESTVSSERARVEDAVVAHVTRDVRVGDRVAIPSGAKAHGEVTFVERGGRLKDRARLGVRFTSIVLADGTRVPIDTDAIVREGGAPGSASSAKIGGSALGGAILGGILGGARGAIIGGSAGAGAGTAAVLAGGRNAATLGAGTPVTVRLLRPVTIAIEE